MRPAFSSSLQFQHVLWCPTLGLSISCHIALCLHCFAYVGTEPLENEINLVCIRSRKWEAKMNGKVLRKVEENTLLFWNETVHVFNSEHCVSRQTHVLPSLRLFDWLGRRLSISLFNSPFKLLLEHFLSAEPCSQSFTQLAHLTHTRHSGKFVLWFCPHF